MRSIPPALQAHLDTGVTTIATLWTVIRRDGKVIGFTDHDRPLSVGGLSYEPQDGLSSSAATLGPGLAVGGADVAGALTSEALSEADLATGLWDRAAVEIELVNWRETTERVLVRRAEIGEVSRGGTQFTAELRSLAVVLDEARGRVFSHLCDADLGDARCKVDLGAPGHRALVTVTERPDGARLLVDGLGGFQSDWFAGGRATVTSGSATGEAVEVISHAVVATDAELIPFLPFSDRLAAGDTLSLEVGCDKQYATCRGKFANQLNFRGFPHMPGSDFAFAYPTQDAGDNDGGPTVR